MLEWAAATFNLVGPDERQDDVSKMKEAFAYIGTLTEDKVAQGSWAAELFEVAASGRIAVQEAVGAISAYVIPSLDTTIFAMGHLLHNLARHPDQWTALRRERNLVPSAVLENMRHSAPLRWFARVAAQDYAVDDAVIPAGARVMILYGCANRDERHYQNAEVFDIGRNPRDHLAFGGGLHSCLGAALARLEAKVAMQEILRLMPDFTVDESGLKRMHSPAVRGYTNVPVRFTPAQGVRLSA